MGLNEPPEPPLAPPLLGFQKRWFIYIRVLGFALLIYSRVSQLPNYFIFIGYLQNGGRGFKRIPEPRFDLPLWPISSICMHTK